jgi:ABC-type branched-subunit amino acid transport system ATPase component
MTLTVSKPVIEVRNVRRAFGPNVAVQDVSMSVGAGEISDCWVPLDAAKQPCCV